MPRGAAAMSTTPAPHRDQPITGRFPIALCVISSPPPSRRVCLPRPAVEIGSEVDGVGARYALADEIVATFVGRRRVGADAAPMVAVWIAVKGRRIRDDDRVAVGPVACQDR